MQRRAPWLTIRVHIRKRSVAPFKPLAPERPAYLSQPSLNQQAFTSDPHFSTPSRLAPAPPPIPDSEASTPPTPTHWHRSEVITGRSVQPINVRRPLDTVFRLQQRTYPTQRAPIVLPLLVDGVLALGGGYTLEGVDDPHVPASMFKLWLRELVDPLVPPEMYNDCIAFAGDAEACCAAVEQLPTANRRVVLFVISFLQLFLDERVLAATKMTSANLLRCGSDSIAVVFNTAALFSRGAGFGDH
ncbi:hypothetical protein EDB89DRAFT_2076763 [Lactarius sanguifluus]|nr:hypothetical protein EDB89DRAFT_2076763 [Lactarius sanguifluus]